MHCRKHVLLWKIGHRWLASWNNFIFLLTTALKCSVLHWSESNLPHPCWGSYPCPLHSSPPTSSSSFQRDAKMGSSARLLSLHFTRSTCATRNSRQGSFFGGCKGVISFGNSSLAVDAEQQNIWICKAGQEATSAWLAGGFHEREMNRWRTAWHCEAERTHPLWYHDRGNHTGWRVFSHTIVLLLTVKEKFLVSSSTQSFWFHFAHSRRT